MPTFREVLQDKRTQLGMVTMYPAPGIIERIGADWDFVWIDGQHGELDYHDMLNMVRACDLVQRPALVRVASHEAGRISLALDMGATGVIVPLVDTPEQARAIAHAAKFPPLGGRSYGGRRPVDRLGRTYSDTANTDTILIAQIESPQAVENAAEIAATPGIDALFLGPDDIMLRRGYPMTAPRSKETLGSDLEAVARAAHQHNKFAMVVGVGAEMLKLSLSYGYDLIVCGGDVPFLANGSKQASADARAILGSSAKGEAPREGAKSVY